jgi:endonuclease/exonuclease/phosphatase family metal-dependent hydrolase
VLASLSPDVVALQEVDVCRSRTGCVDQADAIARALQMEMHFYPCLEVTGEKYGNAVLSRLPVKLVKAGRLPGSPVSEPRGALWVSIEVGQQSLDLFTAHLGLASPERMEQVEALLGKEWMSHPDCGRHRMVCGDLNATPASQVYRRLASELRDVQRLVGGRPKPTWFAPLPIVRIDHMFVDRSIEVSSTSVPRTRLSRVASDHLPLVADLELRAQVVRTSPEIASEPVDAVQGL